MEATTSNILAAAQSAIQVASALAISYAFSIVGALVLLIAGFIVAGFAERWSFSVLGRIHGFDNTLRLFLSKVFRYGVLILVGVTVLAQFGVQTASIIATLGAAGLAIGLALQGTLQNIAAGIMLLVLRPFRVGEYVSTGDLAGTVQEIGLFATELKTFDGLYVLAPNSQLWDKSVTNYTRNPVRMFELAIGIGYDDDMDLAMSLFAEMAAAEPRILDDPAPNTFISALGDSSVVVSMRYWTASPDWFQTKLDMTKRAKAKFDENGISIPFPQRDVHLFSEQSPKELGADEPKKAVTESPQPGKASTKSSQPSRKSARPG